MGVFSRLRDTLQKTRQNLVQKVSSVLSGRTALDEGALEELEEALIAADVGPATAQALVDDVRKQVREGRTSASPQELLQASVTRVLEAARGTVTVAKAKPFCIMVVGVNGVGKTTTIAKLAHKYRREGSRVLAVAADTFRAAAIQQLEIWAARAGCDVVKHREGSDPSAVVYDALSAARARQVDVVIVDTAGRLHTKVNLMNELRKIRRVMGREVEGAPHETLLVLDANTGQNALQQAKIFKEATDVTGIVITKLDGTAKGGIVLAIARELGLPVKLVTTGEGITDIAEFDPVEFAAAMFR
jgi:fused signal recognition particle receptor